MAQVISARAQEFQDRQLQAEASDKEKEVLTGPLEEDRQQTAELNRQLSSRTQELTNLQRQKTEAEERAAALNAQMEESRQRVADLERQVSDRTQAAQGLQSRAETAEKDRKRLTTLYFQLTKQLEDASQQTTELEQQLSDRAQEVEQIGARAEAAEKAKVELDSQQRGSRRDKAPRFAGSEERSQQENGAIEKTNGNGPGLGSGIGQLLKRLLGGSKNAAPQKPAPRSQPAPDRKPRETSATGVRSVSITPPPPPEEKPYKLPRFLSD